MKRNRKIAIIGVLYVFYFVAVLVESDVIGNLLSPIVTIIPAYYVFKQYCIKESKKVYRYAGLLLSLSMFIWFLADVFWAITDMLLNTDPEKNALINYGYSFTNIFLLLSLILVGYQEFKKWASFQLLIDALAISASVMIVIWVVFFNRDMNNAFIIEEDWIAMISIAVDILVIIWTIIWLFSMRKAKASIKSGITPLGSLLFVINDIVYYYIDFYSLYEPNSFIDGVYVISFMLIALGAMKKSTIPKVRTVKMEYTNKKGIYLIAAPIIMVALKGVHIDYLIMLFAIILLHLIFSSYIQKNIYRDDLLNHEKMLNIELERKVKERTKELNDLLNKDSCTGLHSRRYFLTNLRKNIDKLGDNERILLFYIDLNRYKVIKTMFGNYRGEETLHEMGKRLSSFPMGPKDILASYGEDVFVYAKQGLYTYEEGLTIAKEIIDRCSDNYQIEEYDIQVTINIGLSIYPLDAASNQELIKHADIAMTQARLNGFNKVMAYDKELADHIFERNRIELMLKKVLCNDEFFLNYQPQVLCKDGSLIGFEALLRWRTKDGTFIPPGVFIPIAEETGYIIPIGNWVMQKAIEQLSEWNKVSTKRARIAINVSVKQLNESNFISNLQETLHRYQVKPEDVEIEITESIQLEENVDIKKILQDIRNMGISIAIDDFGTGYSSLYYIKDLPINRIKIAKPLIDKIDNDLFDNTVVKSVITIAKVKNIRVIAEGVETKEQWECLKNLECDEIQGYFFGKPMPPMEAQEKWL